MIKLIDQFNNPIPNDLVLLPTTELNPEDIEKADKANWYDADGYILASAKEIDYLSEDDLEESTGIKLQDIKEILLISPTLHRYSEEDGFYHA